MIENYKEDYTMKYDLGDIFTLGENTFMVAENSVYNNVEYLLLNKLDSEEELTNELFVYKVVEDGLLKVTDQSILDIILPVFNNKIQRDIANIQNEEKFNI